ncbi:hypothetical protein [Actinoplanes derwentensis]|uniref:WXG100 family type VII secretion target n=1 Tax=Actinoplanes derwentensis TaxID=113562 RepID=A0A1H2C7S0_9ACTN|nr:hypothetical protein [Actinoplanes derwentensis]GID86536.1 hypothetical protein Ade03nite_54600 [Actinoplanes derwentensis]SDT66568.1 hypothetical protein SAMN04489716_5364 [Actinoplanes derwentensis]
MTGADQAAEADLAVIGRAIDALAAEVAGRLAGLRAELEPTRGLWAGARADLGPADEWTIAADGLLGRDGVVGLISDAMEITWTGYPGVGWADASGPLGGADAPMAD